MTFETALPLCNKIVDFLVNCGGDYKKDGVLETIVLSALATNQFLIRINKEGIQYFVCYWHVRPDELSGLVNGVWPQDITDGSIIYIVEAGNKLGKAGILEIRNRLKTKVKTWEGVLWHRGTELKVFAKCKGE